MRLRPGFLPEGKRWQERMDQVARQLTQVDETATAIVNGTRLGVFADNANFQNSEAEKALGVRFDLYDSASVARLLDEQPNLLPPRKVKRSTDIPWYHKQVANAVTQGILQGESIDKIAKRIGEQTGETSRKAMLRNARTAMTSAQNAGRMEAMHQQQDMGIRVQKKWIAAHDSRTRKAHRDPALAEQVIDIDQPFKTKLGEILFPGDPAAHPANVYNCRCALGYVYPEYQPGIYKMSTKEPTTWPSGDGGLTELDLEELSAYAATKGVHFDTNSFKRFEGSSLTVREVLDSIGEVVKDFPYLSHFDGGITLRNSYKMQDDGFAMLSGTNKIVLNNNAFRNRAALIEMYRMKADAGRFVKGTNHLSIGYHEAGHAVVRAYQIPLKIVRWIDPSDISECATDYKSEQIAESFSAYYSSVHNVAILRFTTWQR